ncbi:MAG: transcription antitermination factor NusB [Candidatus Zophobacter franzmannii]|nr:transcription antitermination factor NusB [Candidatus Zophobacter franzmannii]
MGLRRLARELALKALYSYEFQDEPEDTDIYQLYNEVNQHLINICDSEKEHGNGSSSEKVIEFAGSILKALVFNMDEVDLLINKQSENWTIERLAVIDRELLRIAVAEMKYLNTPPPVVINESIEIAKKYSTENSGKFVNGILDAIGHELPK